MKNEEFSVDLKTGKWGYTVTHDHSDLIKKNIDAQNDGSNGFTKDRTLRRIGSIPMELYVDPDFQQLTTDERTVFLKWFLGKHPQFRTVDKMLHVNPAPGNVWIR